VTQSPEQKFIDQLVARLRAGQQGSRSGTAEEPHPNGHNAREDPTVSGLTDQRVLELLFAERERGSEFEDVYNGDYAAHHPSPSEGLASLLWRFAFYTGKDPVQMERLIRGSGLPQEKFDTRRRGTTWLGQEIGRAISGTDHTYSPGKTRSRSKTFSSSSDYLGVGDDYEEVSHEEVSPLVVERVKDLPRYKGKRPSVIEDIFPTGFPTSLYGEGGIAKSLLAHYMLLHIAAGWDSCLGFKITKRLPCLLVDFELDRLEQGTRAGKLAKGMGLEEIPDELHYLWASGHSSRNVFRHALEAVEEYKIGVACVDSVGMALEGDSIAGSDVIEFFRTRCDAFKRRGCAVLLVDHQSGIRPGESYQDKTQYGSVYKGYLSRSRLQLQKDPMDGAREDGVTVKVRQNKSNFGREQKPFKVQITYQDDATLIERQELEEEELREEKSLNATDRILLTLLDGPAYPGDLEDKTGIRGTRNVLTRLRKLSLIEETGAEEETGGRRSLEVKLTDKGRARARKIASPTSSSSRHPPKESGDDEEVSGANTSPATVSELFADPPAWLPTQLAVYREDPDRHFEPLCNSVAAEVFDDPLRGLEVREEVERELERWEA
jgi:DNA-binding MarR family transcriptional regulator